MISTATHNYPEPELWDDESAPDEDDDQESPRDDLPDIPERHTEDADVIDGWASSEIFSTIHEPR